MITTFEESMLLWISVNSESDELDDELQFVTASNGAVIDFCDGLISLDDMFGAIEYYGADVDDYIEDLAQTVDLLGV